MQYGTKTNEESRKGLAACWRSKSAFTRGTSAMTSASPTASFTLAAAPPRQVRLSQHAPPPMKKTSSGASGSLDGLMAMPLAYLFPQTRLLIGTNDHSLAGASTF